MGGGGILVGDELSPFWNEHEGGQVLYVGDMLWRCPWPAAGEAGILGLGGGGGKA